MELQLYVVKASDCTQLSSTQIISAIRVAALRLLWSSHSCYAQGFLLQPAFENTNHHSCSWCLQ